MNWIISHFCHISEGGREKLTIELMPRKMFGPGISFVASFKITSEPLVSVSSGTRPSWSVDGDDGVDGR